MALFKAIYNILWGDLIQIPLPGGSVLGLSLLVLILVPAGLYFTVRTHFLPFRLFPEMMKVTLEKNKKDGSDAISGVQALIVSTACRVGMGNLVGVVAAISAGGRWCCVLDVDIGFAGVIYSVCGIYPGANL